MGRNASAQYWTAEDDAVRCHLCPHECRITNGRTGICGVRRNAAGTMELPFYGAVSSLAIDPIEKKPLYHYRPGETVFSVGFLGCNLRCPFCQNYSISQSTNRAAKHLSPPDLINEARSAGSTMVACTYNEPTIHFEFVKACSELAHENGLKNVLVTNGNLLESPARDLLPHIDALNVDLKAFDVRTYRKELGGDLATVKAFITAAHDLVHVEVTTLLVPGLNDSEEELTSIAKFIKGLSPDIPLHISAYYPTYKYDRPATTIEEVNRAVRLTREHLHHVYAGNVPGSSDTHCVSCGHLLVSRRGYSVKTSGLDGSHCLSCGADTGIVVD